MSYAIFVNLGWDGWSLLHVTNNYDEMLSKYNSLKKSNIAEKGLLLVEILVSSPEAIN